MYKCDKIIEETVMVLEGIKGDEGKPCPIMRKCCKLLYLINWIKEASSIILKNKKKVLCYKDFFVQLIVF